MPRGDRTRITAGLGAQPEARSVTRSVGRILHRASVVVSWLLVGAVRAYQELISPFFGQRCRYYPSCSRYAIEAVRMRGPLLGVLLAGWRLLRCHPFSPGGIDRVPDRGTGLVASFTFYQLDQGVVCSGGSGQGRDPSVLGTNPLPVSHTGQRRTHREEPHR